MNAATLTILLAVIAGALMAIQAPTNAMLSRPLDSPITAAFLSFLVGTVALGLLAWLLPSRPDAAGVRALPWYVWLGGLYGAFFVAMAAFGAPKVGVGVLLTAVVAGQLGMAVLLDHYGLLGLDRNPINLQRVAGLLLVLGGVVLVRRS
ncbi:DMT family transporter [Sphingosinicella terrae]|jgi:bacterial/archaeal transporter family-2 protein|uniref:DMT family transporter n=1 Tax=Sphingosinicella terrae TaxID=2172047 RepID=UPI000E0D622F|nr:DMT family transporter [Sphingosinicella terrae]